MNIPGLRAWQSAQLSFPGVLCTSSWSAFSLRACWRRLRAPAMSMLDHTNFGVVQDPGRLCVTVTTLSDQKPETGK